jgi:hypothetical protein
MAAAWQKRPCLLARLSFFHGSCRPAWSDAADLGFLDADGNDVLLIFNGWKALIS